jgi:hypothetical protein
VANDEFTRDYEKVPVVHRTRVNVVLRGGERLSGESGGGLGDLSQPKSDAEISRKFLGTASDFLGAGRAQAMLDLLWKLDGLPETAAVARGFIKS